METFVIEIAGQAIGMDCLFSSTRVYFQKYLTDRPPQFHTRVTREAMVQEQQFLNEEADREGLRRRVFAEPFLERAVLQRQTADNLLQQDVLLLHGSTLAVDGRAYLFTADCGVGKSTHTRLWRELLGTRAVVINDDRAFLRITPEGVLACGSPWSGKHGLDTNLCAPLGGICILERGSENRITALPFSEAAPFLLKQSFQPAPDSAPALEALTQSLAQVPLWHMECTKSLDAAQTAFQAMASKEDKPCSKEPFWTCSTSPSV